MNPGHCSTPSSASHCLSFRYSVGHGVILFLDNYLPVWIYTVFCYLLGTGCTGLGTEIQKVREPAGPKAVGEALTVPLHSEIRGPWDVAVPKVN